MVAANGVVCKEPTAWTSRHRRDNLIDKTTGIIITTNVWNRETDNRICLTLKCSSSFSSDFFCRHIIITYISAAALHFETGWQLCDAASPMIILGGPRRRRIQTSLRDASCDNEVVRSKIAFFFFLMYNCQKNRKEFFC